MTDLSGPTATSRSNMAAVIAGLEVAVIGESAHEMR